LVTLAEGLAGLSVPSKAYGIMAAGKPLLFVGDPTSDIARVVVSAACGAVITSGDGQQLANLISDWASDKKRITEMGLAARSAFERSFDRPYAVRAYLMCFARAMKLSPEAMSIMSLVDSRRNDSLRT
jgi:glycosyltransferase involved in cell wall biosynthesis